MNILLVGNSKTLLEKKGGQRIDSFDGPVVRFNNYQIKNFESHTGSRTNWICYRACDDVQLKQADQIFTFITYCPYMTGMKVVANNQRSYYGNKCTIVSGPECYLIAQSLNYKNDMKKWPSIGILAASYFNNDPTIDKIYRIGFGDDCGGTSHYFPKPPKDSCYHDFPLEMKTLEKITLNFSLSI